MADRHGVPIWYEHLSPDADAAQRFYTGVIGWSASDSGIEGMDYRLMAAKDGAVAGLMTRPPEMPGGAEWLIYFAVDDVDATADAVTVHGGAIHMPPMTMPGVGRMAMATDAQSHAFYIMRGESDEESTAFRSAGAATPGHAVWNELTAEDQDAAMPFYAAVLGMRQEGAMPMGDLGEYRFIHAGDLAIGATMNEPPGGRRGWMPYFMVDAIDAGADRIRAAGGRVLEGPHPIPGGAYSLVAQDDAGARFGLVGDRDG